MHQIVNAYLVVARPAILQVLECSSLSLLQLLCSTNSIMSLLLDDLLLQLDPRLREHLTEDSKTRNEVAAYLESLLINDDLLSTETFTTNTVAQKSKKRTLIEEIAELDHKYRQTEIKLTAITNDNKGTIIEINQDLHTINNEIRVNYADSVKRIREIIAKESLTKSKVAVNDKLNAAIKTTSTVLTNVDSVLDYLELPTLCKLCILQGNYQESLEISMTAQSLTIKYPNFVIFRHIRNQVEQELKLMVNGLIKLLNTNLKQSQLLRVFQILRKVDLVYVSNAASDNTAAAKERYLKMIYLNSRFRFIANEIATLKPLIKFNKFTYLKRFIEVYREYLFNSLSLYHLLFSAFDSSEGSAEDDDGQLFLQQFIQTVAEMLAEEFRTHFPKQESTANDDDDLGELEYLTQRDGLILQLIYLCRSLAKFNLDFECILVSEFCYADQVLFDENDWLRNLQKVKKFRN